MNLIFPILPSPPEKTTFKKHSLSRAKACFCVKIFVLIKQLLRQFILPLYIYIYIYIYIYVYIYIIYIYICIIYNIIYVYIYIKYAIYHIIYNIYNIIYIILYNIYNIKHKSFRYEHHLKNYEGSLKTG